MSKQVISTINMSTCQPVNLSTKKKDYDYIFRRNQTQIASMARTAC